MVDLDLGTGTLKAGALTVPGLNLATNFMPIANPKSNEWLGAGPPSGTLVMSLNTEYATPVIITASRTAIALGISVSTLAASAIIRLGIRQDDGTGNLNPSTLLVEATATTQIDASTTGFKTSAAISQALTPGLYWLCAVAQTAAPTVNALAPGGIYLASNAANPASSGGMGYAVTTSGALQSAWGGGRNGVSSVPRVMLELS